MQEKLRQLQDRLNQNKINNLVPQKMNVELTLERFDKDGNLTLKRVVKNCKEETIYEEDKK